MEKIDFFVFSILFMAWGIFVVAIIMIYCYLWKLNCVTPLLWLLASWCSSKWEKYQETKDKRIHAIKEITPLALYFAKEKEKK